MLSAYESATHVGPVNEPIGPYTQSFNFVSTPYASAGVSSSSAAGNYKKSVAANGGSVTDSFSFSLESGAESLVENLTLNAYSGVATNAVPAIPEPSTYALMAGGLMLLAWLRMRRGEHKAPRGVLAGLSKRIAA